MTGVDDLDFPRRAIARMSFTVERLLWALSSHFELLYRNMYPTGVSDGAVSHYALRLEIYGATSVIKKFVTEFGGILRNL